MSRFTANSAFMRQLRAVDAQRKRVEEQASERDRIFKARCQAAGVETTMAGAAEIATRHLLRETPFAGASLAFSGDRLWIGEGQKGNGLKSQAGVGLAAMGACVEHWEGRFTWRPEAPPADVILSVRDWLDPVERWSWDVRRTGDVPEDQPGFW